MQDWQILGKCGYGCASPSSAFAPAIPSRMDGTNACIGLKKEATRPAGANILQQQARFDDFIEEFNYQWPHEALEMQCPARVYTPSLQLDQGVPEPTNRFTTAPSWSPAAAASAFNRKKISRRSGCGCQRGRPRSLAGQLYIDLEENSLGN